MCAVGIVPSDRDEEEELGHRTLLRLALNLESIEFLAALLRFNWLVTSWTIQRARRQSLETSLALVRCTG